MAFVDKFREAYGEPPGFPAFHGYITAHFIAKAYRKAGTRDTRAKHFHEGGTAMDFGQSITLGMDHDIIIEAFLIVTIGELGNMWGALLGSLIFGVTQSLGVLLWPRFAIVFPYLAVVIVLIWRPTGMLKSVWCNGGGAPFS